LSNSDNAITGSYLGNLFSNPNLGGNLSDILQHRFEYPINSIRTKKLAAL